MSESACARDHDPTPRPEGRVELPDPFPLDSGDQLAACHVEYSLVGHESHPLVVVLGGISADRHAARWWPGIVGPDNAIDVRRFRVLGIDWLGSRSDSFSPRSVPNRRTYPLISTHDQGRALVAVLDALEIDRIDALVGASYGGMVALAAASDYPARIRRLVVVSAAHRTHPMATAHRVVQRGIIELARSTAGSDDGLTLARALAMTTYRTAGEFEERFALDPLPETAGRFEVEEYLIARGRAFRERFTPESFAALSHSIDLHRVAPERVTTPVDLVSVNSDELVPLRLMQELEERVAGTCRHHRLRSPWGHDAFLKEGAALGHVLSEILSRTSSTDPGAQSR